jgi:two-component system KDP operon response regulator KdpE
MTAAKILVADDEPQIRRLLTVALERSGYRVAQAASGRELLNALDIDHPQLVLLDLGLPDRDGLELIPLIKARGSAALLVITAREEVSEKIAALDLGADDYVTKPFDTEEVLARVRVALRPRGMADGNRLLEIGRELAIDAAARLVTRAGTEVHLTPKEYAVLLELAKAPGRVITHRQLLTTIWGPAQAERTEYLRVVMRGLRQKLEREPASPELLINEPGVGYRLRAALVPADPIASRDLPST